VSVERNGKERMSTTTKKDLEGEEVRGHQGRTQKVKTYLLSTAGGESLKEGETRYPGNNKRSNVGTRKRTKKSPYQSHPLFDERRKKAIHKRKTQKKIPKAGKNDQEGVVRSQII